MPAVPRPAADSLLPAPSMVRGLAWEALSKCAPVMLLAREGGEPSLYCIEGDGLGWPLDGRAVDATEVRPPGGCCGRST